MDRSCTETCLLKIAASLDFDWKVIGRRLLKKERHITDIDREENSEQQKRDKVLMKWKEQEGSGATYRKLIDTLKELRNKDAAEGVQQLVIDGMLDEVCSHDHLLQMSLWKGDWKGIIKRGQDATDNQHQKGSEQQMEKVLMKWKEQERSGATYRKLIDTLKELGNMDAAERVHSLATTGNTELSIKFDMVQANCGCGKCDLKSLISTGCPKPCRNVPFLYLDTLSLNQKQKDILILKLQEDAEAIFDQWDTIVDQFSSWMEANVSLEVYKKILLSVPGMTSAVSNIHMLSDRKQEIMAAKSHLECIAILSDYYSWFNYSILKTVVIQATKRTHKDASEFHLSLRSYIDRLDEYCRRNIFECPAPLLMSSKKGTTFLVLKVTEDQLSTVNMVSAEKIALFTAELMKPFEIQEYVMNLHTVGKGCMELVYSLPQCITNELFPLNEDRCKNLAILGVMEVITKHYHYKKDHSTLWLQHLLPYKTIGAEEKKEELHNVQEISPPSEYGITIDKQTASVHDYEDTFASCHDPSSSKGFFDQNLYKLLMEDVKLRDSIAHYTCKDKANWRALIWHVGLEMDANQLINFPPEDILLTIVKEWNDQKGAVTVRHFCNVCNELRILEVEQYMKTEEEVGHDVRKVEQYMKTEEEVGHDVRKVEQYMKTEEEVGHDVRKVEQDVRKNAKELKQDVMEEDTSTTPMPEH